MPAWFSLKWAIVAVVGLFAALGVIGGVRKARRAWRNSLLGMITQGVKDEIRQGKVGPEDLNMRSVVQAPPKSVSDLSLTLIPRIAKDYPDLNVSEMQSAAQAVLVKSLQLQTEMTSGTNGDTVDRIERELCSCGIGVTRSLCQNLDQIIGAARSTGKTLIYRDVCVHKGGINEYKRTASTVEITFQYSLQYLQYQERNGKFISGNRATPTQARYNVKVINILDATRLAMEDTKGVGFNCPHCGAPVRHLGTDVCEFCGTAIKTVDMRVWLVDQLLEI
ncbi:MAG: hypothetical protein J5752_09560 [Clostridiales bacterium]|nr:hypothetical protein [Clostridiales bacterium]